MNTSVPVGSIVTVDSGGAVTPGEHPRMERAIREKIVISDWMRANVLSIVILR
jgi:hypothetical protein